MKTVIIGSGNVAFHLTKALSENHIQLAQIFGRNETALKEISEKFSVPYSTDQLEDADIYIIAVSDNSVAEVSEKIQNENCIVAHTSGSLPISSLNGNYRKAGFYPLQTFSKVKNLDYTKIPFFIEAENETDQFTLEELAGKISDKVMKSDYEKRKYIHLTAVFSCNFVNHLFARAKEISDSQEIPFTYFIPLIDETVEKIKEIDPKSAQTGPAVRNDSRVLALHKQLIYNEQQQKIYDTMNESIRKMYEL